MADRGMILHRVVLWNILFLVCRASPQSNYADRGVDVEYQGNGLPQEAVLDGVVTKLDELSDTIRTNRTTASLSCASRAMEVDLEFTEPFHGIVYADFNRHTSCSFAGNGELKFHYEFPLSGCGTIQDPLRVFTNNIIVRFHPSLELEGDEVKTIVCRYPEPVVPPPLGPPLPISVAEKPPLESKPESLGELQILLIICALLFLALMLFGVACSYFCLKQRNIKLIRRRRALSSGPGSVVTKMSESTLQLPMFDGLKIPRAHAPSNSGSDQALITGSPAEQSDTLPSDYPSESRSSSEIEEGDTRSLRRPSTISSICQQEPIENAAFVHQEDDRLSSVYSDAHPQSEFDMFGAPTAVPPPTFDVAFRVTPLKRKSPSPPSSIASDDSRVAVMRAQERQLSTILEKEEWRQSAIPSDNANVLDNPDLNQPALVNCPPTANYAQVQRKPRSVLSDRSIPDNDNFSVTECEEVPQERRKPPEASFRVKHRAPSVPREPSESEVSTKTLMINEDVNLHTSTFHHVREDEESEMMIVPVPERPVPPPKLQEVDDLYLRNVTEKRIVEENERLRRNVLEYHQRPRPLPPNWDVTIRKHPPVYEPRTPSESTIEPPPDWNVKIRQYPPQQEPRTPSESTWDTESQPPPEWDVKIRQYPPKHEPRTPSESTVWDAESQPPPEFDVKIRQYPPLQEPRTPSESNWDAESQPPPDWDVKIRQYPPLQEPRTPSESTNWDAESQPPPDWDVKIRQYPPVHEPRTPSESTNWDGESQPPPDWDVKIRQYPPVHEPRTPSESNWDAESQPPPDWDVKIRQYPPVHEPRTPSESTNWDGESQPPPDWDVKIRQYPPVHEPRTPSESNWDGESQPPPDWDVKIRQYPPVHEPRTPSESTNWDAESQPPPDWDVNIRQYPPIHEPRSPSHSTMPPDWDVKIRQYPPIHEPRTPSESTNWDAESQPPPDWDVNIRQYPPMHEPRSPSQSTMPPDWNVKIRQHPPVYEPRTPSDSTDWDHMSQPPPDWDVNIRQYPPIHERRSPSASTMPPDWDVKIRQHPPVYEPRTPSDSTDWDHMSQPPLPPNWDVKIRQHPPVYEPRTPSESTDWDGMSQTDRLHADDVYLRTITEKHITEEDELVRRHYMEYRRVPKPRLPPNWDVTIRQHPPVYEPRPPSDSTDWASDAGSERPPTERPPINWNVLIRVLQPPVRDDDISSILTEDDRDRWHHIITTESVLRTMLTEAVVREDFERIRHDTRFERIFEPRKWDVIIRVLAPPNVPRDDRSEASESTTNSEIPPRRYRKRSDASRSGLAPVREGVPAPRHGPGSTRSGRSSKSGDDVRSLTETTVNFAKYEPDAWSQSSGHTYHSSNYPRSMADRSHSEIMEHQAMYPRADWDDESERMSRPSLARSTSEYTENNWSTQRRVPFDRVSSGSGYSSSSNRKPRRLAADEADASSPHEVTSDGSSSPRQFRRRVPYERVSSSESETGSRPE